MNPLIIFFILALFINDILFNSKRLTYLYLFSVISYALFCILRKDSLYDTPERKWNLASYSQSHDPSVYAKVKLDVKNAKTFIEEQFKITGKKISYTLFFAKALSECIKNLPEANIAIRFGKVELINNLLGSRKGKY